MKSKLQTVILSLFSAVVGGFIVATCCLIFISNAEFIGEKPDSMNGAGAGYKMLEDFQCRYGETKHIFMNGLDDNFTLGNSEPGKISARLAHMPGHPANGPYMRDYDESGKDKNLVDYFSIPPKTMRGVFATRIQPKGDYDNDYISLGDFSVHRVDLHYIDSLAFSSVLNELSSQDGWSHHGAGLYSVQLSDIIFKFIDPEAFNIDREYSGLLEYLQDQKQDSIVEVMIADDIAVDFTGFAICTEPKDPLGLTFYQHKAMKTMQAEFEVLTCDSGLFDYPCNPIYGDTVCSESLPVACFKDVGLPVPDLDINLPEVVKYHINGYWSGGLLKFTSPVRGQDLKTLQEANNLCAGEFGDTWRVLDFHDGGKKNVIAPITDSVPESRFWVDIKDQPKGTCWSRLNKSSLSDSAATP